MIKQVGVTDINSRSECHPYNKDGFLPLYVAPMYSVLNEDNQQIFLDQKIQVCSPRGIQAADNAYTSMCLEQFIETYINNNDYSIKKVLIDTAVGHLWKLHNAIRTVKKIGDNDIKIIAGNVSTVDAFVELALTGVDGIRVGIGGSNVCGTTLNTGTGQKNLEKLVKKCWTAKQNLSKIENVDIIADGISSFVNKLVDKKQGLSNGYAAINRLLYNGADAVMIGFIFASCIESACDKYYEIGNEKIANLTVDYLRRCGVIGYHYGMSTKEAQLKYNGLSSKHSEGKVIRIPIKYSLSEWLNGSDRLPDEYPGFVNCLRSAMSYAGARTLNNFKK